MDRQVVESFRKAEDKYPVGSLETTHGVIRLSSACPCFFVSAITDREGYFDMEVTPGQNYITSFYDGIVFGQFVVDFNNALKEEEFKIGV